MKLNYRILILTFFAFSNLFAFNPNDEIGSLSGKILDSKQQPIIGASVVLKGTVRGVATNDKGEFILKSQIARSQLENKKIVIDKMNDLINQSLLKKKFRIATKISQAKIEKRIEHKKIKAEHKKARKKINPKDY